MPPAREAVGLPRRSSNRRAPPARGWLSAVVIAVAVGTTFPLTSAARVLQRTPSPEEQVKAAFVARFPGFVQWPANAFDGRKTLDVCVARPSPFGGVLSELVEGETAQGWPLAAREVSNAGQMDGCHVLFVPNLSGAARRAYLSRARTLPTLTVSDTPNFVEDGGIIELRTVDGRVRFEINAEAAREAGLQLSSQLLRLAVAVHGGPS